MIIRKTELIGDAVIHINKRMRSFESEPEIESITVTMDGRTSDFMTIIKARIAAKTTIEHKNTIW